MQTKNLGRIVPLKGVDYWTEADKQEIVSEAVEELDPSLNTKQDKTDNNLQTTSKQVVGAINELNNKTGVKFTQEEKEKLAGLENYDDSEIITELGNKVGKEEGKGLSTNDFTNAEKEKLESLENYDDSEIREDITDLDNRLDTAESDIETLQTENQKLLNQIPTNKETPAKNLHLTDSSDLVVKDITLRGESTQDGEPSPDNEVPIVNIEGNVNAKFEGKNRFDKSQYNNWVHSNISRSYWTITELNTGIRLKTTYPSSYPNLFYNILDLSNYVGKTIKMKATITNSETNMGNYFIGIGDSNGENLRGRAADTSTSDTEISLVVPELLENQRYLIVRLGCWVPSGSSSGGTVDYTNIMVTIDDEIINFEPYKSQSVLFPLEGQKLMEGSYLADDGIHNVRTQVIFDGSNDEGWAYENSSTYPTNRTVISRSFSSVNTLYLSTHFIPNDTSTSNRLITTGTGLYLSLDDTIPGINVNDDDATKLSKMLAWLSNNPVTLELQTEEIIPYTTTQQEAWNNLKKLSTYKNITNITSDALVDTTYRQDLQTLFNKLATAIVAIGG